MKPLGEIAFRQKLNLLTLFVSLLTLLLASTILLWRETARSAEVRQAELLSLAKVLGATSIAALEFGDARAAQEDLSAVRLLPDVVSARLYSADGRPFASYARDAAGAEPPPEHPNAPRARGGGRYLAVLEPVDFGSERVGWIFIEADLGGPWSRLRGYAWTVLFAVVASAGFAWAAGQRLQRAVSGPVERLTAAVGAVAERGDYSVRVPVVGGGELAVLSGGFNQMLVRIQEQDAALRGARDELERKIEERVRDLRREIQDRQAAEVALQNSERKYRSIVENTKEWIWSLDSDARWTYHNPAIEWILGYRPEELLGRSYLEIIHEDDREKAAERLASTATTHAGWSGAVLRWRHRDGAFRTIESTGSSFTDVNGQLSGWQGVDRDITDQLFLEAQLRQAQKMEAVGRLAGGIAHDFNNLLSIVIGHSELLIKASTPVGVLGPLKQIRDAAERGAGLTRQLLAFSRRQMLAPKILDLNSVVLDFGKMLPRLLGEDVELVLHPGQGLGTVKADPAQIAQVIMNLAVNARDAMPHGGRLEIHTGNLDADEAFSRTHPPLAPGRFVALTVSDNGCGMDRITLSRLFEPFFTTKEVGKGTGLGLSTVYGIVKQSGGYVFVESHPGVGSTFQVYLPRVDGAADDQNAARDATVPPHGTETVLLVEDETALRTLVAELLVVYGYRVIEAACGGEALRAAAAHAGPIELLLTDVVMPGMSGRELAERLTRQRAETRVLYMSGYTRDSVVRQNSTETEASVLQKPFASADLARRVRQALDQPAA